MNEDEATRLFCRAADTIAPIPRPPTHQLIHRGKRTHRRRRLLSAGSVAVAAALIVGAGALWLPGSSGPPAANGTTAPDHSALPAAPAGTRWVGFNGVMVAVPQTWVTDPHPCDRERPDAVTFWAPTAVIYDCVASSRPTPSILEPLSLSSPPGERWRDAGGRAVDIDGVPATRAGKVDCLDSDPPPCVGSLVIPSLNAVFVVSSPDPDVRDLVLDTARLVPAGYTSVPNVQGTLDDVEPADEMEQAGLSWAGVQCDDSHLDSCIRPTEVTTDPEAGTVVPVGTTVSAATPFSDPGFECVVTATTSDGRSADVDSGGSLDLRVGDVLTTEKSQACGHVSLSSSDRDVLDGGGWRRGIFHAVGVGVSEVGARTLTCPDMQPGAIDCGHIKTESLGTITVNVAPAIGADELAGTPPTESDLLGAWRLMTAPNEDAGPGQRWEVSFTATSFAWTGWNGYDGCNNISGRVAVDEAGAFAPHHVALTTALCLDSEGDTVNAGTSGASLVGSAGQVRLDGERLSFYSGAGELLGTFVRIEDEQGVRIDLLTHCGVVSVTVDEQLWLASPRLGGHSAPEGWGENSTPGYFLVTGPETAEFHGDGGQRADFLRAEPGAVDPWAGCE